MVLDLCNDSMASILTNSQMSPPQEQQQREWRIDLTGDHVEPVLRDRHESLVNRSGSYVVRRYYIRALTYASNFPRDRHDLVGMLVNRCPGSL